MAFNLLTTIGLRQDHRLLDIGCGSMRIGRLLIPYLLTGNYFGIEPFKELCKSGVNEECGDIIIKREANIIYDDKIPPYLKSYKFDFILLQSIFTHCDLKMIRGYLSDCAEVLDLNGIVLATFFLGAQDSRETGWKYPGCTSYKLETIYDLADEIDLVAGAIDWDQYHGQTWFMFRHKGLPKWFESEELTWNNYIKYIKGNGGE
jgi:SAM-dependent methyltransferase